MGKNKIALSASTMKTLSECSYIHWCKKHLMLPEKNNDGARRGTICHAVLEYLQHEKHSDNYDRIIDADNVEGDEATLRLTKRHFEVANMDDKSDENLQLVKDMIMIGLKNDFFCLENDGKLGHAEQSFLIENQEPEYLIRGFIDKHAFYDNGDTLKIIDYKSSKKKFKKHELDGNPQAMMYTLAAKTLWPNVKKIIFNFLFLKPDLQKKGPVQELEFNERQLRGFEYYVSSIYKLINNFTEKEATANFAADNKKNSWMCAAGPVWVCPHRDPYDYYVLLDEKLNVVNSSRTESQLVAKKDQTVEKRRYDGCPRWTHLHNSNQDDVFGF